MTAKTRANFLKKFLQSGTVSPVVAAVAAGLYPIFFYFSNNYTLVNTWGHLGYFALYFLLLPVVGFVMANRVARLSPFEKWRKYLLPFLNIFVFLFLMKVCLYAGMQKKMILGILVVSALFTFFLHRHLKKVIVLQFVLALIGLFSLLPTVIKQISYSSDWLIQPDNIEAVVFKTKPNVYFIQPDGYVNFSELKMGHYAYDNSEFEAFLAKEGFTNYPNFRSNYATTLSSNSATYAMKHHYYNKGTSMSEALNARDLIVSDNAVLRVFKKNGYKTNLISELPYLLLSRPRMGYDYCNYNYNEINYIGTGLRNPRDIIEPLASILEEPSDQPNFFFVEMFNPGHIANRKEDTKGREIEKAEWFESLEWANEKLTSLLTLIKEKDPGALIMISADHGGSVGFEYSRMIYTKTQERDLVYSIFSSQLSIHWPDTIPKFEGHLKTPVNLYRHVFSYLSEDESYLQNLQEDETFIVINEGAPRGIYKYIDSSGNIVFKRVN
jgi:hypothetical protein